MHQTLLLNDKDFETTLKVKIYCALLKETFETVGWLGENSISGSNISCYLGRHNQVKCK